MNAGPFTGGPDELDALLPNTTSRTLWDRLTPEHQQWVKEKFAANVPAAHIAVALQTAGYKLSASTVKSWRT